MTSKIKKLLKTIPYKDILIILISGAILSLAFIKYQLGWIMLFGAVPFFWHISNLEKRKLTNKQFIMRVWGVGVVFFAITVSWIYTIRATDLIADPWLRWLFLFLTLAIIVLIYSSGFLLFAYLFRKLRLSLDKPSSFLIIPAIWIVGEYLRSIIFSIVWIGDGASIGDYWNFGNFGFGASVTPMVYAGRLIGVYGLSFLVVLLNLAIFQLIFGKRKKQAIAVLVIVALIPSLGFMLYKTPASSKYSKVGLSFIESDYTINGKYETPLKESILNKGSGNPSLLIMPEYSGFLEEDYAQPEDKEISKLIFQNNPNGKVISSQSVYRSEGRSNAVVLLDKDGNIIESQDKQFLIPGGEYVPYFYQGILVASGNSGFVVAHQKDKTLLKGADKAKPIEIDGIKYGVLACSGAIAPNYYRQVTKDGAEILINVASIASMGLDGFYFEQSKQMVRFQAVANSRVFLQSARGGQSYIIDRNGKFVLESQGKKTQYYSSELISDSTITLYTFLGEWVLTLSLAGLVGYTTFLIYKNIRNKN